MNTRRTIRSMLLLLATLSMVLGASAQSTASGSINSTLINKSGISLVFNSDASGLVLSGAGSYSASLDFGTISAFMAAPSGITLARSATDFTVSSPFDVLVQQAGMTSASYNLQASLQSPAGVYTYQIDGIAVPLAPSAATIVSNDTRYGTNAPHTLSLAIPATAPAGTVTNTINFVATAN